MSTYHPLYSHVLLDGWYYIIMLDTLSGAGWVLAGLEPVRLRSKADMQVKMLNERAADEKAKTRELWLTSVLQH